jgi:hypothetical protein
LASIILLSLSVVAQAETIKNWGAPSIWTPPAAQSAGGRAALANYPPVALTPLAPCRLIDTRAGSGFPAGYGPPSMTGGGAQRTFTITGQCGIPAGAQAVSFNFAVWFPTSRGDIRVFPAGTATPTVSTLNWEASIVALANAAVVPLGTGGAITVQMDATAALTDIFVDVNGYYAGTQAAGGGTFNLHTDNIYAIWGESTAASGGYGTIGRAISGTNGIGAFGRGSGYGVFGTTETGASIGVHGDSGSNTAVEGISTSGLGVFGQSSSYNAIWAQSATFDAIASFGGRDGIFSQGARIGVLATTTGTGVVDGVQGTLQGAAAGSAGVHGIGAGVANTYGVWGQQGATIPDVFGQASGTGGYFTSRGTWAALGNGPTRGVQGSRVDATTGNFLSGGVLGYAGTSGVHSFNDITAAGIKSFVEPHPTDPGRQIVYIAMEGPEAGTYFRGRGRFSGRTAVIEVPESFRLVTEAEGLTVQITPIGQPTAVGVTSVDLNQIVVEANRDVEFSYLVQGVRHHHGQFEAIQQNTYFVPASADARMDPWPPQIQKLLVDLGIYSSDGRVNMQTAEKMGWAQKWRDDGAKLKAEQEAAAAQVRAATPHLAPEPLAHSSTIP